MSFPKPSPMMAYLVQMAARLVQMHRVLKPTGSLYLHCDPTASHYLKTVLDAIFGPRNLLNEVIRERFNFHADAKRWGRLHAVLLVYGGKGTRKGDILLFRLFPRPAARPKRKLQTQPHGKEPTPSRLQPRPGGQAGQDASPRPPGPWYCNWRPGNSAPLLQARFRPGRRRHCGFRISGLGLPVERLPACVAAASDAEAMPRDCGQQSWHVPLARPPNRAQKLHSNHASQPNESRIQYRRATTPRGFTPSFFLPFNHIGRYNHVRVVSAQ